MDDYSNLYVKSFRIKKSCMVVRSIKKLITLDVPPDIMLILVIALVLPGQVLPLIRK